MNIFDTNMFALLLAEDENVLRRFLEADGPIYLSSIAAKERLVGVTNSINKARAPRTSLSLARAHTDFSEALATINRLPILAYSEEADSVFKTFSPAVVRKGSQDCRIAAQAIAHGMTVITRNLRDFKAIGVPCVGGSA